MAGFDGPNRFPDTPGPPSGDELNYADALKAFADGPPTLDPYEGDRQARLADLSRQEVLPLASQRAMTIPRAGDAMQQAFWGEVSRAVHGARDTIGRSLNRDWTNVELQASLGMELQTRAVEETDSTLDDAAGILLMQQEGEEEHIWRETPSGVARYERMWHGNNGGDSAEIRVWPLTEDQRANVLPPKARLEAPASMGLIEDFSEPGRLSVSTTQELSDPVNPGEKMRLVVDTLFDVFDRAQTATWLRTSHRFADGDGRPLAVEESNVREKAFMDYLVGPYDGLIPSDILDAARTAFIAQSSRQVINKIYEQIVDES